jgi:hypothetical protein
MQQNLLDHLVGAGEQNQITSLALLAFAFPSESSHHSLARINGAGLFSRSKGQLVALQFEKSHLVRAREKFTPRYVDLGRKLVSLDREFTGVRHERLQECCRVSIVCCWLAICRCDDERHGPKLLSCARVVPPGPIGCPEAMEWVP